MFKKVISWLILLCLIISLYGLIKAIPEGLNQTSSVYEVNDKDVQFFADRTYLNKNGERVSEQQIFDGVLKMIKEANHYILIDMFLYNSFLGTATTSHRQLADELTQALIDKKKQQPEIIIQVISDPINTIYGGYESPHFKNLSENNIPVILTDLTALRDSNPLYSGLWRTVFQWLPDNKSEHLPNILDVNQPKTSLVAYLNSFNFKANHRKLIVTDYKKDNKIGLTALITSANPHDGSSAHSNTAIKVDNYIWKDVITSEKAVANFSQANFIEPPLDNIDNVETKDKNIKIQLLTEQAIKTKILETVNALENNDHLDMMMFYISDRDIIKALKTADERGVNIKLIFDPNKDAFGREKNGMPNRQVASELINNTKGNTEIRWCDTHGEQCHSKLMIFKQGENYSLIQGSANLTRRNLDNFNLETDVFVSGTASTTAISDAQNFFTELWENNNGKIYTTDYQTYQDDSLSKKVLYFITEFTGLSSY